LRSAVGTAIGDKVQRAALTAIERELLAHDADRFRVARRQVRRQVHRLPESTQVATGPRAGPRVGEVPRVRCRPPLLHALLRPGPSRAAPYGLALAVPHLLSRIAYRECYR